VLGQSLLAPGMAAKGGNGVYFSFARCSYSVETTPDGKPASAPAKMCGKTMSKVLINDLTAHVKPGHVLSILGPSGAGKTTLLNMLSLQKFGGKPQGFIRLNGNDLTLKRFEEHCAYVPQQDALWATLTVREHLNYSFELFQPELTAAERKAAIDELILKVGLSEVQDTKAGNQFMRGLSGGHKRRLSIALAMSKKPSVLYLDGARRAVPRQARARSETELQPGLRLSCSRGCNR
jgi:ABC-type multidrug transport system ATPase subunit